MEITHLSTANYVISQAIFLRLMGGVYFAALASLLVQCRGLYGKRGLAPISEFVAGVKKQTGKKLFSRAPSIFWWGSSDLVLQLTLAVGMLASIGVILGLWQPVLLFVCWAIYLSFMTLGSKFLGYQWDSLLLEVGFLSIFYSLQSPPSLIWQLLYWFLLFRFMFSSGAVKLSSGCPAWRSWKAMDYHYETQPIPNLLAWFAHQQPKPLQRLAVAMTFLLELIWPFLIFMPHPGPLVAAIGMIGLQAAIMLTGNYAFFNILSIGLCLLLVEDRYLTFFSAADPFTLPVPLQACLWTLGLFMLLLNALQLARLFARLGSGMAVVQWASIWHLCNPYGLFARMTTVRDEIIIEGSDDGVTWKAYEFKWKPGDLKRRPGQVAPHQPRLDWQMWFAALGTYQQNDWYLLLLKRILEGEPVILRLMALNPFPNKPPRLLRSRRFRYRFSNWKHLRKTGEWWVRRAQGEYAPTVTLLDDGGMVAVEL